VITIGCVLGVGFAAFATLRWGPVWLQVGVAYAETWLLLTSEIAGVGDIIAARFRGRVAETDDAAHLAEKTHIPGFIWIAAWLALIGWALWKGVPLLWP
jgi:hypothetical protein